MSTDRIDTIVIGAGQAGLATSHELTARNVPHLVLDRGDRVGDSWRNRWDSFTLVTPNWQLQLPGFPYTGDDPDGFLHRDDVVRHLQRYTTMFDPPVRFQTEVTSVGADDDGLEVRTADGETLHARNVVVATGTFAEPRVPDAATDAPDHIHQVHSSGYRNPDDLPDGPVLVVGSGQSGCQIAMELADAGRDVHLSTSRVGRLPRRYRDRDGMWWAHRIGLFDQRVEDLDSPDARFQPNPHVSGRHGGTEVDLRELAASGITLHGHLERFDDDHATFADDLDDNLAFADESAAMIRAAADRWVEASGLDLPEEPEDETGRDDPSGSTSLDLGTFAAIVWATGFDWDFDWVEPADLDERGYPIADGGVAAHPGLYFVGLHWLEHRDSGLFLGVGRDATTVAIHLASRPASA